MMINHHYKLAYRYLNTFHFKQYNDKIGVKEYEPYIYAQLPDIIKKLNDNKNTRQAILIMNRGNDFMSCLISIQFQIFNSELYVTVNLRSQAREFMKKDARLFCFCATRVLNNMDYLISKVNIDVYVGNFH